MGPPPTVILVRHCVAFKAGFQVDLRVEHKSGAVFDDDLLLTVLRPYIKHYSFEKAEIDTPSSNDAKYAWRVVFITTKTSPVSIGLTCNGFKHSIMYDWNVKTVGSSEYAFKNSSECQSTSSEGQTSTGRQKIARSKSSILSSFKITPKRSPTTKNCSPVASDKGTKAKVQRPAHFRPDYSVLMSSGIPLSVNKPPKSSRKKRPHTRAPQYSISPPDSSVSNNAGSSVPFKSPCDSLLGQSRYFQNISKFFSSSQHRLSEPAEGSDKVNRRNSSAEITSIDTPYSKIDEPAKRTSFCLGIPFPNDSPDSSKGSKNLLKEYVRNRLVDFFESNSSGPISLLVCYHGACDRSSGAWELRDGLFSFSEMWDLWRKSRAYLLESAHLYVTIDSNHSDFWVRNLEGVILEKNMGDGFDHVRMSVQANSNCCKASSNKFCVDSVKFRGGSEGTERAKELRKGSLEGIRNDARSLGDKCFLEFEKLCT